MSTDNETETFGASAWGTPATPETDPASESQPADGGSSELSDASVAEAQSPQVVSEEDWYSRIIARAPVTVHALPHGITFEEAVGEIGKRGHKITKESKGYRVI